MSSERPLLVSTRRENRGGAFHRALTSAAIRVWAMPTTRVDVAAYGSGVTATWQRLSTANWLVFTSVRAVDLCCAPAEFHERWRGLARPPKVAAVGPVTAARLRRYGLPVHLEPPAAGGGQLARLLIDAPAVTAAGSLRVLWPRARNVHPALARALRLAGASLVDPVVYAVTPVPPGRLGALRKALSAGDVWCICFWSATAAHGLVTALGAADLTPLRESGAHIVSIGPSTSETLRALAAPPTIEGPRPDGAAVAAAVLELHAARSTR